MASSRCLLRAVALCALCLVPACQQQEGPRDSAAVDGDEGCGGQCCAGGERGAALEGSEGSSEADKRRGRGLGAFRERIRGRRGVVVVSVVFSSPRMLEYQIVSFRAHLRERISEYIVIVDSPRAMVREFEAVCQRQNASCRTTHWDDPDSSHFASHLHGQALDWAWTEHILEEHADSLVLITEQDVFMFAPFSVSEALAPGQGVSLGGIQAGECTDRCTMGGVLQERTNDDGFRVQYLHPSAIIVDVAALPMTSHIHFSPTAFNGTYLDTGGMLAQYWDDVNSLSDFLEGKCLKTCLIPSRWMDRSSCFGAFEEGFGMPDIYHGALLHLRRSSLWDVRNKVKEQGGDHDEAVARLRELHAGRLECLWKYLHQTGTHFFEGKG